MKYNSRFSLTRQTSSQLVFQSETNVIQMDFFQHCLRVALTKNPQELLPTFSINPNNQKENSLGRERLSTEGFIQDHISFSETEEGLWIQTGDVNLQISLKPFHITYLKEDKILFQDRNIIAYNFEGELGIGSYHYLSREDDEEIFGLGDKSGNINKAGRNFKLETMDAMGYNANSSDPLYKQIPFYICRNSVGSYGIYYDSYANGELNFGEEHNNYYMKYKKFHSEEEDLVFYVIFGTPKEIVQRFSEMTGDTFFPPKWSFRYGGSTMSYTDADNAEEQLRGFLSLCKEYDVHCGQFYLSSGYTQIGEKRYVFHWNKEKISDPKQLSDDFKKEGIHFLPNIKPAFLTDHPLYDFIKEKGWFLYNPDYTPYVFPFWGGMGSYLDFTNPEAFDFWTKCVKENLVDYGFDSLWNDNNEYDIQDETVLCHGFTHPIPAKRIRPVFSFLMSLASHKAQNENIRFMNVTRSGISGLQRIAQTWTGDNNTSFEDFRGNHHIAMTMSLSGLFFFGADIGGFAGPRPEKELFLRWIQYGLFQPRFVLHSWNPDGLATMPWLYPEEKETIKKLFNLRNDFLPYIYSSAYFCVMHHLPLIYPIFLEYPDYDVESDTFFFGDDILVTSIFDEGKEDALTILPNNNGGWYYQGKEYVSGHDERKITIHDTPAYYVKGGSVIPSVKNGQISFTIYPKDDGAFDYQFFDDDGISNIVNPQIIQIHVECTKDKIYVSANGEIDFRCVDHLEREIGKQ